VRKRTKWRKGQKYKDRDEETESDAQRQRHKFKRKRHGEIEIERHKKKITNRVSHIKVQNYRGTKGDMAIELGIYIFKEPHM
jgi:hypothetical protein